MSDSLRSMTGKSTHSLKRADMIGALKKFTMPSFEILEGILDDVKRWIDLEFHSRKMELKHAQQTVALSFDSFIQRRKYFEYTLFKAIKRSNDKTRPCILLRSKRVDLSLSLFASLAIFGSVRGLVSDRITAESVLFEAVEGHLKRSQFNVLSSAYRLASATNVVVGDNDATTVGDLVDFAELLSGKIAENNNKQGRKVNVDWPLTMEQVIKSSVVNNHHAVHGVKRFLGLCSCVPVIDVERSLANLDVFCTAKYDDGTNRFTELSKPQRIHLVRSFVFDRAQTLRVINRERNVAALSIEPVYYMVRKILKSMSHALEFSAVGLVDAFRSFLSSSSSGTSSQKLFLIEFLQLMRENCVSERQMSLLEVEKVLQQCCRRVRHILAAASGPNTNNSRDGFQTMRNAAEEHSLMLSVQNEFVLFADLHDWSTSDRLGTPTTAGAQVTDVVAGDVDEFASKAVRKVVKSAKRAGQLLQDSTEKEQQRLQRNANLSALSSTKTTIPLQKEEK